MRRTGGEMPASGVGLRVERGDLSVHAVKIIHRRAIGRPRSAQAALAGRDGQDYLSTYASAASLPFRPLNRLISCRRCFAAFVISPRDGRIVRGA